MCCFDCNWEVSGHIVLVLVGGAKVARIMKKRKDFFQVFLFSFILQGFHGEKKWRLIRQNWRKTAQNAGKLSFLPTYWYASQTLVKP